MATARSPSLCALPPAIIVPWGCWRTRLLFSLVSMQCLDLLPINFSKFFESAYTANPDFCGNEFKEAPYLLCKRLLFCTFICLVLISELLQRIMVTEFGNSSAYYNLAINYDRPVFSRIFFYYLPLLFSTCLNLIQSEITGRKKQQHPYIRKQSKFRKHWPLLDKSFSKLIVKSPNAVGRSVKKLLFCVTRHTKL